MRKSSFLLFVVFCLCFGASAAFAQETKESRPLKITEKPVPELPYDHLTLTIQGTVQLNVQFLSWGDIGQIVPVSNLPHSLTQNAIDAAKKIKFEPELEKGVPTTVFRIIDYPYSWNGGWKMEKPVAPDRPAGAQVEKAEAIIKRGLEKVGGQRYLQTRTVYGKGIFSTFKDGVANSFNTFTDIIVFPDKERTEFKQGGYKNVQTNTGNTGWIYGEDTRSINNQTQRQIDSFKRGLRTSLDNILRGGWLNEGAKLSYIGRREAGLGKRNEVIRLTYSEDFWVEFEFSNVDGLPSKAVYEAKDSEGVTRREEDRYAQFVDINGVLAPYIIDHFSDGKQTSRINYEILEFNKNIPMTIFNKPADIKEAKRDIKF
jgi:Gram-negative bacterial TonB protein C-terminal